jgi:hypothetical protein
MRTTQRALIRTAVIRWLPLACVVTALAGLVYLAVQQTLRLSANDPQIQLAEDAGAALAAGQPPQSVLPGAPVDVATSLRPYVIVLRDSGEVVASSATLHGQSPAIPDGVLAYAREHGEERVSWQPEAGVRSAAVVVRYAGPQPGFVLAGRSLREVEYREQQMLQLVAAAWLATLLVSFVGLLIGGYLDRTLVPHMVTG